MTSVSNTHSSASHSAGDFSYGGSQSWGGTASPDAVTLAIYADRPHLREQVREDAMMAGYSVAACHRFADLVLGGSRNLAEVVLVDCPAPDGAGLARLAELDTQARAAGTQLIVATSSEGLEDVFGCVDQSAPQLLVDASAAELALALGRAAALRPGRGVREMADEDRMQLMRLTEQVGRMAAQLDAAGARRPGGVESPALAFRGPDAGEAGGFLAGRNSLPDPRLVRRILRQRHQRTRWFDADLFADPAWDMLLDLTAAKAENKRVSVTSLCIASGVPPTTALRWITQLTHAGLFQRVEDKSDRRRAFIALTDKAADAMSGYFATLGDAAALPV